MKFSAIVATSALAAAAMLPEQADAHAFLLLPKVDITIPEKNFYAYVVPGEKVPPFSSYTTGNAEKNSQGFTANYKKLNPPTLRDFILKNEEPAKDAKPGGTAACGYSNPNEPPQPLPDHIEFGNYGLNNPSGLHPGPCEAWCDDECVIPFTPDCRTLFQKPIPYAKDKCVGKSRFTFYWLATHFAPFQVYIGCAPLAGGKAGGGGGGAAGGGGAKGNSTTPTPGNGNGGGGAGGGNGGGAMGGNDSNGGGKTNEKKPANNGGNNNKQPASNNGGGNSGASQTRNNNAPAQGGGTQNHNSQNAGRSLDFGDLNHM